MDVANDDTKNKRTALFKDLQISLLRASMKSYNQVIKTSQKVHEAIKGYLVINHDPTMLSEKGTIDTISHSIPTDFIDVQRFPLVNQADGNCLAHCGGIFTNMCDVEVRVRIVIECTTHESLYLSHKYLSRGLSNNATKRKNLPAIVCQYSDQYTPGTRTTEETIQQVYRAEVMKVIKEGAYMGIWQMFALASVMGRPIISSYPIDRSINVYPDLNRTILPREEIYKTAAVIMWTSTQEDMETTNLGYWEPNHFVPLIPMDHTR